MTLPDFLCEWPFGEIMLTGHRIGLYDVMARSDDGMTPEQIQDYYPTLPLDGIRPVIAFAEENKEQVSAYVRSYEDELARQNAAAPRRLDWEKLLRGLAEKYQNVPQRFRA
jgi:uncharacterized protein (DUF433 family)